MSITGSFENLLLVTDGSEFSEGAVREALRLAKQCAGKVTALNVVEFNPEFAALAPEAMDKMESDAKGMVDAIKDRAQKDGVSCDSMVLRSVNPHEQIVEEAGRLKADAIVMGRRGRTGIKRLLMGSVTARVIGHSPVKVLVVPKAAELKFGKILVATDGSSHSEAAAAEAVGLAKCSGGSVLALAVAEAMGDKGTIEAATDNANKVKSLADKEGVKAEAMCEKGRAEDVIVDIAKKEGCDLIAVGSHGRTGIKRLLMGSTAERVVGHAECAVLVVKTEQ
jgi:nucleotide-binding universal stress UspA family protein